MLVLKIREKFNLKLIINLATYIRRLNFTIYIPLDDKKNYTYWENVVNALNIYYPYFYICMLVNTCFHLYLVLYNVFLITIELLL